MVSLPPEIDQHYLRPAEDLEHLCDDSVIKSLRFQQQLPVKGNAVLTASMVSKKTVLESYNPVVPEPKQQGVIAITHELQQKVSEFTGYASVSLSSLNHRMAIFACLSMIIKHHQRNRRRAEYIVLLNPGDEIAEVAEQLGLRVTYSDSESIQEHLNEQCAALVMPLPGLNERKDRLSSVREDMDRLGIPLYVDGSRQYLLPAHKDFEWLKADILHLDLAYICGLTKGVNAILTNTNLSDYLPVPMAAFSGASYHWNTLENYPLSVGMLSTTPVDLQAALHCLVYFRMQGYATITEQAKQSLLIAGYLQQQLTEHKLCVVRGHDATGSCSVSLDGVDVDHSSLSSLLPDLTALPISVHVDASERGITITLGNLHLLDQERLQQLLEMFILQVEA
jgi:glycine cleavage system protein P-like pyridoxal-binding family